MVTVDSEIETIEQYNDAHSWLNFLCMKHEYGGSKGENWREEADWLMGKIKNFEDKMLKKATDITCGCPAPYNCNHKCIGRC